MNKYDVVKTIGEGAYGVVLQCKNKESGELVAIKRFKESDEDELVRKTTLREVRILRLLKDEPYVVRLQEAFRRKGKLYLVFDYVGCNLLDVLEQHPQGLPNDDIRRMVFTMLLGIRACHANGVIHRDIKPENLLVHEDKTLRLCDFGFARIYSNDMNDLTDYVATRWYRSPELLLGTTDYGLPSDIWAVGCIMAELVDGQAIFPCETEVDQIFVIQKLLGNFTSHQMEVFRKNPRFNGYTLKEIPKLDSSLERKFTKKASKKALALLKQMLVIDPSKRCSVDEALAHPYFEGLAELYYPQLLNKNATPFIRPPSASAAGGSSKISALARPPSSLNRPQRVGTPSETSHNHHSHHHNDLHSGGEDMGGEHDGSAPHTGGGARGPSPWSQTSLPRAGGASSAAGGTILPPARIPSASRQHGGGGGMLGGMGDPMLSNRVPTPGLGSSVNSSVLNPYMGGGVGNNNGSVVATTSGGVAQMGGMGGMGNGAPGMMGGGMMIQGGNNGGYNGGMGGSGSNGVGYGVPQAPMSGGGIGSTAGSGNAGSFIGRSNNGARLPMAPLNQPGGLPRLNFTAGFTGGSALIHNDQQQQQQYQHGGSSYFGGAQQQQPQQMYAHQQQQQQMGVYGNSNASSNSNTSYMQQQQGPTSSMGGGGGMYAPSAPHGTSAGSSYSMRQAGQLGGGVGSMGGMAPPTNGGGMYVGGGAPVQGNLMGGVGGATMGGGGGGYYVNGGQLPPRAGGVYSTVDSSRYQQPVQQAGGFRR